MMNQNQQRPGWDDEADGLLTGLKQGLQRRKFLALAAKTAGVTGCLAVVGVGSWISYLRRLESSYQQRDLTCSDVRELLPAYLARNLDARRTELLEKHVRRCPQCAGLRKQLHAETT